MKIYFQLILFGLFNILIACKPGDLSNTCDPNSEAYRIGTLVRFLIKDDSASCLPGFSKTPLDLWGVHDTNPANVVIRGVALLEDKLYLGGTFSYFGPNTGAGAILNTNDGKLVPHDICPYMEILTTATVAISDGENGFYVGGLFNHVQGFNRPSLVHIKSNCKLDLNFNVGTGSNGVAINDLALVGEKLYIGGNFTNWNGVPKGYLAAVNRITGELDPGWLASVDAPVNAFAKDTDGLFIAGQFNNLNGAGFGRLGKVNYTSGATITSFNTGISVGNVRGITLGVDASNNKVIYAVGNFTAGTNYFARSFTMSGNLTTWNPNPNALVDIVVFNQNKVYLAGSFTQINGATNRNYFAIVDNNTGTVGSEDLSLANGSTVASLTVHEGKLYVLGTFSTVFGRERLNAFSVDPLTGNISDWNPRFVTPFTYPNGKIAFSSDNSRVFVPGAFSSVNIVNRNGLGSIDLVTGKPTEWIPTVNGSITTFHQNGDILYVGGNFTQAFGQSRMRFFAYNLKDQRLEGMSPSFIGVVEAISSDENFVYVGGQFQNVNGQLRNRVARFPKLDGTLNSWNPNAGDTVEEILPLADRIFLGGNFTDIAAFPPQRLAAVSTATGANLSFPTPPNFPDATVHALGTLNNLLFFGGNFDNYGSTPSPKFGVIDLSSANYLSGNISFDNKVLSLGICENGKGGIGGSFTTVNGKNQEGFILYDFLKRAPMSFNPFSSGSIQTVVPVKNRIFFAGSLSEYQNRPRGGYYILDLEKLE
ncbi:MAG: hypothetical protein O9301_01920 [Leptospira sp.]|nr:hypothetical protein [Leptospira sp.]